MESKVRGSGRPLPGANETTMAIWYELHKAGEAGLTREALITKASPAVPRGFAWRRYLQVRGDQPDDEKHHSASIRYLIGATLADLIRSGSAFKRTNGTFSAGRKPKSSMARLALDEDLGGVKVALHVQVMEALRVLKPACQRVRKSANQKFTRREIEVVIQLVELLDANSAGGDS